MKSCCLFSGSSLLSSCVPCVSYGNLFISLCQFIILEWLVCVSVVVFSLCVAVRCLSSFCFWLFLTVCGLSHLLMAFLCVWSKFLCRLGPFYVPLQIFSSIFVIVVCLLMYFIFLLFFHPWVMFSAVSKVVLLLLCSRVVCLLLISLSLWLFFIFVVILCVLWFHCSLKRRLWWVRSNHTSGLGMQYIPGCKYKPTARCCRMTSLSPSSYAPTWHTHTHTNKFTHCFCPVPPSN